MNNVYDVTCFYIINTQTTQIQWYKQPRIKHAVYKRVKSSKLIVGEAYCQYQPYSEGVNSFPVALDHGDLLLSWSATPNISSQ